MEKQKQRRVKGLACRMHLTDLGLIKSPLSVSAGCGRARRRQGGRHLSGQGVLLASGHELSDTSSSPVLPMYLHQSHWKFPRDEFDLPHLRGDVWRKHKEQQPASPSPRGGHAAVLWRLSHSPWTQKEGFNSTVWMLRCSCRCCLWCFARSAWLLWSHSVEQQ